jgi:hypothetical protein
MFCTPAIVLYAVYILCPVLLFFCSSLISCFPGMLVRYCLNDFGMVPVAPIITGIYYYYFILLLLLSLYGASAPFRAITTLYEF